MRNAQALVVVLLVLGVALTVGMAVVSRSVTEVKTSTTQDETLKALEAAEVGVEKSLSGVIPVGVSVVSGSVPTSDATFNVTKTAPTAPTYESDYKLDSGDVATVDLTGYAGNRLDICWGNRNPVTQASIEVALYFKSGANYGVGRIGYDGNGRWAGNGFVNTANVGNCGGVNYGRKVNSMRFGNDLKMPGGATPLFLRIRMLYNISPPQLSPIPGPEPVAVVGTSPLPAQAVEVTSTGQFGDSVQKLVVTQLNPDMPYMFDAALFSGGSVAQY